MKRVFSFLIAIIVTISISYNVQALRADSIRPQYANARQAEVLLSISFLSVAPEKQLLLSVTGQTD